MIGLNSATQKDMIFNPPKEEKKARTVEYAWVFDHAGPLVNRPLGQPRCPSNTHRRLVGKYTRCLWNSKRTSELLPLLRAQPGFAPQVHTNILNLNGDPNYEPGGETVGKCITASQRRQAVARCSDAYLLDLAQVGSMRFRSVSRKPSIDAQPPKPNPPPSSGAEG